MFKRCFGCYFLPIALYGPQIKTETRRSVRLNDFQFFRCRTAHGCDYRTTRTEFGWEEERMRDRHLLCRVWGWGGQKKGIEGEFGEEYMTPKTVVEQYRCSREEELRLRPWSSGVVGQELKLLRWGNCWLRLMSFWNKKCCSEGRKKTNLVASEVASSMIFCSFISFKYDIKLLFFLPVIAVQN